MDQKGSQNQILYRLYCNILYVKKKIPQHIDIITLPWNLSKPHTKKNRLLKDGQ